MQPLINFDLVSHLYRSEQPDFATWHSNHAAHYMHHYWRAWDDSQFKSKSPPDEREKFGEAVPYGYQLCDELLGRAFRLIGDQTVLVVASSMGQQPFVSERYDEGKIVVRIKDIERLLAIVGRHGIDEVVPTMVPQWNLAIPDAVRRRSVRDQLAGVRRFVGGQAETGFSISETGHILTITPIGLARKVPGIEYEFPATPTRQASLHALNDLFATDTPTVKQGMHHIDGVLAFYGKNIRRGAKPAPCTNLDVASTLLALMGLSVPTVMKGHPLLEAVD